MIKTATLALRKIGYKDANVNVSFVKDKTIKKLNKMHRGKDYATDVLSYELPECFPSSSGVCVGDIIISVETASRNAKEDGKTLKAELMELLVHGILHLCGYDHEDVPKAKRDKMFKMQGIIMKEVLSQDGRLKRNKREL